MSVVSYEIRDGVALIRLDDGKANALSYPLMEAVDAALDRADREAQAVVLAGRPGRFSAGFDLKEMMAGPDRARAIVLRGGELLLRLYGLPQPLVVACTGHALAGGALALLAGDHRIGARGAFQIGLNEVAIGMPLPVLAVEFARDRLSGAHLTASTLFASIASPEQALAAGWVDALADEASVVDDALAQAKRLGGLARDAYAKTKRALRERTIRYIRDTMAEDIQRLTPPVA